MHDTVTKDEGDRSVTVYRGRRGSQVQAVSHQVKAPLRAQHRHDYCWPGVISTGKPLGVRVVNHNETPGLGDKIETSKSDWILR